MSTKKIKMTFGKGRDGFIEQTPQEVMHYERESKRSFILSYIENLKGNRFNEIFQNQTEKINNKIGGLFKKFKDSGRHDWEDWYYHSVDESFLEDQLYVLSEMNIIYIYKEFEINLKKLIKKAYGDDKNLYKWSNLIKFFKSKKIILEDLEGYNELNELRVLNNHLKHSDRIISNEIKNIKEFKGEKFLTDKLINKFFHRIKSSTIIFLSSIVNLIYEDLYEFDERRIKQIAEKLAKRMDKKDAKLYWEEIQKYY